MNPIAIIQRKLASGTFCSFCFLYAFGVLGQAPIINQQPASQTIFCGDPVTFTVAGNGAGPLAYQWLKNGAPIPSATQSAFTLAAVASTDQGAGFCIRLTNAVGSITSAVAVLTVDPGLAGAMVTNHVLDLGGQWRYEQTSNLDDVNWTAPSYDDSGWPSGAGLLAYENNSLITPLIHTILTSPQSPPAGLSAGHAYYFRTTVTGGDDLLAGTLLGTIRCDDGAAIYINGVEAKRVRMLSGTITNLSLATGYAPDSTGGSDATVDESIEMPGWGLQPGTNVIAVSVHQVNTGSSDVVWGLALDAVGYQRMRDTNAPTIAEVIPAVGTVVPIFGQLEVHFNKGVKGVDASDLLINGVPATNVTVYAPDIYVFDFSQPAAGPVQVTWSTTHGILDLTANSNYFGGGSYSYTLDPTAITRPVFITEFMAANQKTIRDEDGHYSDWLELFNASPDPVDLGGWYLTDNAAKLTKWRFPAGVTLLSQSYLLVWASGNDRTNPAAPLHTNFKLDKSAGSFLGLVYANGTTIVSAFTNCPQQFDIVSYGRDRLDPSVVGYFTNATPGQANASVGAGFGPEVHFSVPSGTFAQSFSLTLSAADPGSVIRYFLVRDGTSAAMTNLPNSTSPLYTGPLSITGTTQVRARAFPTQAGYLPGPPHSETYLQLDPALTRFSSDLPIVIFHTMGGGDVAATTDQPMTMQVFDTAYGRSSPTNMPDQASAGIFHRRGQATFWNPKPSLRVETRDEFGDDRNVALAGFPSDSDWVFYGIDQYDKTLMHNRLAHQLYRDMGYYTSRTRFIEVYINTGSGTAGPITSSDYQGLYVLEEKIKIGKDRVDIDKVEPENTNAPSVTGGYILSIDKTKAGDPPQLYVANCAMTYVEPDYYALANRPAQQQYITDYLNAFYTALNDPVNWTNAATGYAAYIDLNSWIDYNLHQTLVFNVDALRISAYFHKPRGGKLVQGPLWDFDRCFCTRTGDDARAFNPQRWRSADMDGGTDMFNAGNTFSNPWYSKLFTDPDFWQRWIDRYQQLRRGMYSLTNLYARVDQFGAEVREATGREYVRWLNGGGSDTTPRSGVVSGDGLTYTFPSPGSWQGELNFTKWWFSNRVAFMDGNFLKPPSFNSGGGAIASGFKLTVTATTVEPNSTIYYTLDGSDPRLPGGAVSPKAIASLNTATITLSTNARVVARNYNAAHHNLTGANNPPISSSWSGPLAATFYTGVPPLRVTELMYHPPPVTGNTNDADRFEFIELQNISDAPLNLQGFRLHGGIDFTFPNLTIAAGQQVLVVKDLAAFQSRYGSDRLVAGVYTNNLANTGDHVILDGPVREPILDFTFQDGWYPVADGLGFSLVIRDPNAAPASWNLKESWRPSAAWLGSPGQTDPTPTALPGIVINEALTHTDPPLEDAIELFNPTDQAADISGWFLTDDRHAPLKYRIPDGTVIASGGYLTISSNQFSVGPAGFSLSSIGEEVYLFSGDATTNLTGYAHGFAFGAAPHEVAFCRYVNSQGDEQFVLESANTLGVSNTYPRVGPVVISEIMYRPPDLAGGVNDELNEFIELHNITATNVPLYDANAPTNTWRLRHAVDFDFPTNVFLSAASRLVVVGFDPARYATQLAAFRAKYAVPTGVPILDPWKGKLNNAGDRIELQCPDNPNATPTNIYVPYYLVEAVDYSPAAPWPTNADGGGASLQRIQPALFGNEPLNWFAASPTAGQAPSTPTIDTQPIDQTVAVGANVTFVVAANGAGPLSYQWQWGGTNINGATGSAFTLMNAQLSNTGNYLVIVSNAAGTISSAPGWLTVLTPPSITMQPVGQTVLLGAPVNLSVEASGSSPLGYQWRLNGQALPSQTQPTLTLAGAQTSDGGGYSVVVSNDVGAVTSSVASVTVLIPPAISSQPASQAAVLGATASFTVTATGTGPLSYQWRFNGADIRGATISSLNLPNVQTTDAGTYSVVITNQAGSQVSANATLTVLVPPAITTQPANQTVNVGSNATFSVTATGTAPLSYQWRFNGAKLNGATLNSYALANVQTTDAGTYSVVITNQAGSQVSANVALTVLVPPAITAQPSNQTVNVGSNATFSVTATGTAPLRYQWRLNGAKINGATLNNYTLANVQTTDAGTYSVVITNQVGSLASGNAALTVNVPPAITEQPANQTAIVGSNATFSVTASGTAPLSYQWRFNGASINGATLSSYVLSNAQTSNAGSYAVTVTNAAGSVTSLAASLTVLGPPLIIAQPTNQVVAQGKMAKFSVEATSSTPLAYEWYFNSTNLLARQTNSDLVISNATPNEAGDYRVVVANGVGSLTSAVASLTVLLPPAILVEPAGQRANVDTDVILEISATGSEPLSYQWYFNGTNLAGATGARWTVTRIQPRDAGDYLVTVTNLAGAVTSRVATVTVSLPGPVVSSVTWSGTNCSLSVVTTQGLTYYLESKNDLGEKAWASIGAGVPGTGGVLRLVDPNAPTGDRRFYRVRAR